MSSDVLIINAPLSSMSALLLNEELFFKIVFPSEHHQYSEILGSTMARNTDTQQQQRADVEDTGLPTKPDNTA